MAGNEFKEGVVGFHTLGKCPRCIGGKLLPEIGRWGWEVVCINCGFSLRGEDVLPEADWRHNLR